MELVRDVPEKLEVVLSRLEGVHRQSDGSFRSRCPVHGGKTTDDMKLTAGDVWINIHCFAGCDYDEIRRALGLEWVDLVLDDSPAKARKGRRRDWRAIELESYACAARLQHEPEVLERMRFGRGWAAKAFESLMVGWDGSRLTLPVRGADRKLHDVLCYDPFTKVRKIIAGKGKSRQPWPSPELVEAKGVLFLVEGEGTAISMASVGFQAIALPGSVSKPTTSIDRPGSWQGAGWHKAWAERFAKFRTIVCLPDCDPQGRALMRAAQYDLTKAGVNTHVVDIGPKSNDGRDIADHLLRTAWNGSSRKIARNVIRMMVAQEAEVLVA